MNDHDGLEPLRRELRSHLRDRGGATPVTPSCLSDEVLARLVEGDAAPEVRAAAVAHLDTCARCRAGVTELARALRDPQVAGALAGHRPARRWLARVAVPLAAAAGLLVVLRPALRDGRQPAHRERGVLAAPAPVPRAPVGSVARVGPLSWSPTPGADRYRVTLFDGGRVLYDAELRDTLVVLPDSVPLRSGPTYLWKVDARTGFDRWVSSDLVRFHVVPGARP